MPHDQNNKEIQVGDIVIGPSGGGIKDTQFLGVINSISPGSDACNASMQASLRIVTTPTGGKIITPCDFSSSITMSLRDCTFVA